jgi:hypothetical protein
MTSRFWRWYLIWSIAIVLGACTIAVAQDQKRDEHIYDTSFGSVLCARYVVETCGIHLSNCHDGATYRCMLNVRERGN